MIFSCKKEESTTNDTPSNDCIIYSKDSSGSKVSSEHFINSNGKLVKIEYSDSLPEDVYYKYSGNMVIRMNYVNEEKGRYVLSSNSYAIRLTEKHNDYIDTTEFEYDAEGYLIKSTWYSGSTIGCSYSNNQYSGGNLIKTVYTSNGSQDSSIVSYEYYLDKESKNFINGQFGQKEWFFYGKRLKNLVKKKTFVYYLEGSVFRTEVIEFIYELNDKGYVSKKTDVLSSGHKRIYTYQYSCD